MSKLEIYCVTNKAIKSLEKFHYTLCSVGKENFSDNYLKSNTGDNIFFKRELLFRINISLLVLEK